MAKFESVFPLGTQAHLAVALFLYTACRIEDVVRLGPQHISDGLIKFRQAKNEHRRPVDIVLPVHPNLKLAIDHAPSGHLTFLVTEYGKPFSKDGFGNKMRGWCDAAGLAHCSAHGLRKAIATLLAENGCTSHEIASFTGHSSLEEVERYTKKVEQKRLAQIAFSKLR